MLVAWTNLVGEVGLKRTGKVRYGDEGWEGFRKLTFRYTRQVGRQRANCFHKMFVRIRHACWRCLMFATDKVVLDLETLPWSEIPSVVEGYGGFIGHGLSPGDVYRNC